MHLVAVPAPMHIIDQHYLPFRTGAIAQCQLPEVDELQRRMQHIEVAAGVQRGSNADGAATTLVAANVDNIRIW